jgi:hypothetical protein
MADTQAYYSGLIVTIDAKISALIASPQVDYAVGNVRVSASQKLKQLMDLREMMIKRMAEKPYESIEVIQSDFSAFGENLGSFVDENP